MKKFLSLFVLSIALSAITQVCMAGETTYGLIYKNVKQPGGGSGSSMASKVGESKCRSFFGIVATGNCSIKKAMENGKINTLSYYDEEVLNILGFKVITTKVYGE